MAFSPLPTTEGGEERYAPLAEINVTPMVDVMLVLLVIFMVTAPLLTVGVPLDLPKARATAATEPKPPIVVSLDREGSAFIGDERMAPEALEGAARRTRRRRPEPRSSMSAATGRSPMRRLMDMLGEVNHAGFAKVSLSPRPRRRSERAQDPAGAVARGARAAAGVAAAAAVGETAAAARSRRAGSRWPSRRVCPRPRPPRCRRLPPNRRCRRPCRSPNRRRQRRRQRPNPSPHPSPSPRPHPNRSQRLHRSRHPSRRLLRHHHPRSGW